MAGYPWSAKKCIHIHYVWCSFDNGMSLWSKVRRRSSHICWRQSWTLRLYGAKCGGSERHASGLSITALKYPEICMQWLGWLQCLQVCCRTLFLWGWVRVLLWRASWDQLSYSTGSHSRLSQQLLSAACGSFTNERIRQPCANARKSIAHKKIHVINQLHKHSCQKMQWNICKTHCCRLPSTQLEVQKNV